MDKVSKQVLLKKNYGNGQQAHQKMLSIIIHQKNANQNHSKIALHTHSIQFSHLVVSDSL